MEGSYLNYRGLFSFSYGFQSFLAWLLMMWKILKQDKHLMILMKVVGRITPHHQSLHGRKYKPIGPLNAASWTLRD